MQHISFRVISDFFRFCLFQNFWKSFDIYLGFFKILLSIFLCFFRFFFLKFICQFLSKLFQQSFYCSENWLRSFFGKFIKKGFFLFIFPQVLWNYFCFFLQKVLRFWYLGLFYNIIEIQQLFLNISSIPSSNSQEIYQVMFLAFFIVNLLAEFIRQFCFDSFSRFYGK